MENWFILFRDMGFTEVVDSLGQPVVPKKVEEPDPNFLKFVVFTQEDLEKIEQNYVLPMDILLLILEFSDNNTLIGMSCKQLRNKWNQLPINLKPKYTREWVSMGLPKERLKIIDLDSLKYNPIEYPNVDTVHIEHAEGIYISQLNPYLASDSRHPINHPNINLVMIKYLTYYGFGVINKRIKPKIWKSSGTLPKSLEAKVEVPTKVCYDYLNAYISSFPEYVANTTDTIEILVNNSIQSGVLREISDSGINFIIKLKISLPKFMKNTDLLASKEPLILRIKQSKRLYIDLDDDTEDAKYIREVMEIWGRKNIAVIWE